MEVFETAYYLLSMPTTKRLCHRSEKRSIRRALQAKI